MSDSESFDYLQPEFDPWSLTIPRLRSILVAHDIQYPATAKKGQLIDIFNEDLVPKSKKILAKAARAKRSSKGIVDMASSQDTDTFNEQELLPPPSARRSRSPRKASAKVKTEEYEPELPSPTKRKVRAGSRQLPQASDTDTGPDPDTLKPVRNNRRTVTPQVKVEEPEDDFFERARVSDVFSSENPFQSGSSPPPVTKTPSSRRKTTGMETIKSNNDAAARRRTDGHFTSDDSESKSTKSFEIPINKLRRKTPEVPAIEPGEEFTPEEQFELEQEMAASGEISLAPHRSPAPRKRTSLTTPLWALGIALLGGYAAWYRQQKVAVGYCGLGRPPTQILPADFPVPEWAVPFVEPQCEPCPQHAYCYEDYSVRCETDFILKPHPLSLANIVPLPPSCEPDGEKVRRVKAVADKAVEELRDRRAKWECGELVDEAGQIEETPAVEEEELKESISKKRSKKMNKQEFDDLWVAAIGEVKAREEVEVVHLTNQIGFAGSRKANPGAISNTFLSSTSLARLPITCAIKRSVRLGLARHRLSIGSVITLIAAYFYALARYRSNRAAAAQVPALVDLVLARLATQKELGEEEIDDPWLFLPNLRDDVLRAIHSLGERERIWQRVRAVVELNSNVRTSQRESRSGELGRAWEWIGPIAGDSARRRRSGRVSWGPDVKGDDTPEVSENKIGAHSKWEESRPIY